jgi:type I restriction enzyme S subunit
MSWEIKTIGDVCTIEKGNIGITKAIAGDYPLVVLGEGRKTHNEYQFDDEAVIIPLVSSTGRGDKSMKRIHYQSGKFSVGNILCAVIPKNKSVLSAQYLYRYLDLNKESELVSRMKGMANVSLPMKSIAEVEIPIPPVEIQHEIVARLSSLEESNNELFEKQYFQLDLLKKLRQQILQDAVQGKLIPHDTNDEPASVLLERIKAEKEKLVREKKIKKEKPVPPIKPEEIPFEIPENWVWCRFSSIATIESNLVDPFDYPNHPHIAPDNIEKGTGRLLDYKTVKEDNVISSNHYFFPSQLIYSKVRPRLNKVVKVDFEGLCSADMYPIKSLINPDYLLNCILSKYFLDEVFKFDNRVKMPKINQNQLSQILIPVPPIQEQKRIKVKIEILKTICNELEQSIKQNEKYTQELLQVALKEALEPQKIE